MYISQLQIVDGFKREGTISLVVEISDVIVARLVTS